MTRSRSPFTLALLASLPLLGSGCNPPVEGQQDAGRSLHAMLEVVGPVSVNTYELPDPWRSAAPAGASRFDDYEESCPDGGEMRLTGWSAPDPELDRLYAVSEFEQTVEFRRCKAGGVVLRGELDYALTMDPGPSNDEPSLEWSYRGELRLSGDVRGTCAVDLVASGDHTDAFGHAEARSFTGTMCGLDAEDVVDHADLEAVF